MIQSQDSAVTLQALISERDRGVSLASVMTEVIASGDPVALWRERHPEDLFGSSDTASLSAAAVEVRSWRDAGYRFVSIADAEYPQRLRMVHDAPPFLFYRGDLSAVELGRVFGCWLPRRK